MTALIAKSTISTITAKEIFKKIRELMKLIFLSLYIICLNEEQKVTVLAWLI